VFAPERGELTRILEARRIGEGSFDFLGPGQRGR